MAITKCVKCKQPKKQGMTSCPHCGVVYAKAEAIAYKRYQEVQKKKHEATLRKGEKAESHKKGTISKVAPSIDDATTNTKQRNMLVGVIIMSLVIGYFAGREHIKYEMRQAMAKAANAFAAEEKALNDLNELNVFEQKLQEQAEPPLKLVSFNCVKEHGYVFARGEVTNLSPKILKNVVAVGTFRTADGTLVKSEDALLEFNPIMPGQTSPFSAGGTDNPAITKCGVNFKIMFGGNLAHEE